MKAAEFAKLNLSREQVEAYVILQKVSQAWTAMIWMLILFTVGFFAFLYSLFAVNEQGWAKLIVGGIDTLMAYAIHSIFGYLFPKPGNRATRKSK
jgi:hypothetical protein